jgi:hypothetical protein
VELLVQQLRELLEVESLAQQLRELLEVESLAQQLREPQVEELKQAQHHRR